MLNTKWRCRGATANIWIFHIQIAAIGELLEGTNGLRWVKFAGYMGAAKMEVKFIF